MTKPKPSGVQGQYNDNDQTKAASNTETME